MDSTAGQVISVDVRISDGEVLVATLHERFMVRGRTGASELVAPASVAPDAEDKPRARLDRFTVTAPALTWARSPPSAATTTRCTPTCRRPASRASTARSRTACGSRPSRSARPRRSAPPTTRAPVRSWLARWVAPLLPDADVEITVERTGVVGGDTVVEVTCRVEGELMMVAEAVVAAPAHGVRLPGPGHPEPGHGSRGPLALGCCP